MTKDFLLRLTEEHYGAGVFPVYGRLLEEQQLTRGGPLLPMWYCTAALRRAFEEDSVLVLGCTNDSLLAHLLGATPVNPLPEGVQGMFEVRILYPTDRLDPLPSDVPPLHTAYRRIKGMGLRLAAEAWTGAERDAVERGRMAFEDVLTLREDVYELLRQHTPPKQRRENGLPWAISEDVRKGKYAAQGMPKLIESYLRKQLRVPAHYIEAMKHIRYLPRKGDCVGRMMFEGER